MSIVEPVISHSAGYTLSQATSCTTVKVRAPFNQAEIELFSLIIHENLSVPHTISLDQANREQEMVFDQFSPLQPDSLSIEEKRRVLGQLTNLFNFLEHQGYQTTKIDLSLIGYHRGHIMLHGLPGLSRLPPPSLIKQRLWDNWRDARLLFSYLLDKLRRLWQVPPPLEEWTRGHLMTHHVIITNPAQRALVEHFLHSA